MNGHLDQIGDEAAKICSREQSSRAVSIDSSSYFQVGSLLTCTGVTRPTRDRSVGVRGPTRARATGKFIFFSYQRSLK